MASHITIAQASLSDPRTCPQLIDWTLQQCLLHSRPVYIELPADMVSTLVDATNLQTKIELPGSVPSADEAAALELVLGRIYAAKRPMILVDGESKAYGIVDDLHELIKLTQWPTWTTAFSKSIIEESLSNVHGIWQGDFAGNSDKEYVKSADLILCFGPHFSNTNTYISSSIPDPAVTILFKATSVESGGKILRDLPSKQFLHTVLKRIDSSKIASNIDLPGTANGTSAAVAPPHSDGPLTQEFFYKAINQYLRPGDIILGETGTAGYGVREFLLPPGTFLFKPVTWLSIGYMLPATLGAALAQRELHAVGRWHQSHTPRTVLIIGDGSFQMTAQELSVIIREKLNVLLVLINNDGYTIERCLHGYREHYNDIAHWNYLQAPALFGASETKAGGYHSKTSQAATWGELERVLQDERGDEPMLKMIEVFMDREDAPAPLLPYLNAQRPKRAAPEK